ncbi:MAG: hypothetical protein Q8P41_07275 [Pseudomonadota bacterium]|nr:hypothetical protein [Pseudomonadota bacterium]
MRNPWILVVAVLLATLFASQAGSVQRAWVGESVLGHRFDRCQAHLAADPVVPGVPLAANAPQRVGEGCDTIYSLRIGWDAWRRARTAWEQRTSVASFVFVDYWQVAVEARALNVLDLVLFMWPARLLLPPAAALTVMHLGLVVLAGLSGVLFARLLRLSPLAGLAAGLVTASSGVVLESLQRGQYPQATLVGTLLFFPGLVRILRGERGGVALAALGAALSCLLYWQNALVLGVGAVLLVAGTRVGGPFVPRAPLRLLMAAGAVVLLCLPGALPVVQTILAGTESKLAVIPWGTPFPLDAALPDYDDLLDEVPWYLLLSPRAGWIPVLPLLPLAAIGVWRRDRLGWALLIVVGLALSLGPLPVLPGDLGTRVVEGYGSGERGANPVYLFVYQWLPTASRMRHPIRWSALLVVGMAACTAYGIDRLRARFPDHALLAVVAGLGWAAFVGPWPLRERPFPQDLVDATATCSAIVLPSRPNGPVELDDVHRLEGLLWLPRAPEEGNGTGGVGRSTEASTSWSRETMFKLSTALNGDPTALGDACVIYEPRWVGPNATTVRAQLVRTYGAPIATASGTDLFAFNGYTRQIEVYRGP